MKQIIVSLLIAATSTVTFAQDHRPSRQEMEARMQKTKEACKEDKRTFCSDVEGREAMGCLIENRANLTKTCSDLLPKGPPPGHNGQRPPFPSPGAPRSAAQ